MPVMVSALGYGNRSEWMNSGMDTNSDMAKQLQNNLINMQILNDQSPV